MRRLIQLIEQFRRDEQGAFLALFGVMAIVVVAMSGAVVDFVSIEQARNRAQVALDAAVLALQPSIYVDTNAQLMSKAEALLIERIGDASITATIQDITTDQVDGTLYMHAQLTVPMSFVSLVGINQMTASVVSQATRKKLHMEIAMVLDNSGSMANYSRMSNLKTAAKNATDILFDYQDTQQNTFISVVPFNFWVNIGASNATASWMNQSATSGIALDNFDDDDDETSTYAGPLDRFALYDQISNASWAGCVEARVQPYDANDTVPDISIPDTLFVPTFAPDEPSGYANNYLSDDPVSCQAQRFCESERVKTGCYSNGWGCDTDDETFTATYGDGTVTTSSNACSCSGETLLSDTNWVGTGSGSNYTFTRATSCQDNYSVAGGLSQRELQERLCKYQGSTTTNISSSSYSRTGPNGGCVSTELLPLINNRLTIKSRIDSMVSYGYTNIHQGAIWGFRSLSPTEPFTEGRSYDTATYKVMILMTDGENTYVKGSGINGSTRFTPYGHLANGRLGTMANSTNQMEDLVDGRLIETCTNAKAQGIDIFTIGLEPPNQSVIDMLTACATSPSDAYFPASSSELTSVFETIALQLADLRLSL